MIKNTNYILLFLFLLAMIYFYYNNILELKNIIVYSLVFTVFIKVLSKYNNITNVNKIEEFGDNYIPNEKEKEMKKNSCISSCQSKPANCNDAILKISKDGCADSCTEAVKKMIINEYCDSNTPSSESSSSFDKYAMSKMDIPDNQDKVSNDKNLDRKSNIQFVKTIQQKSRRNIFNIKECYIFSRR